jgi:hypothetical protein
MDDPMARDKDTFFEVLGPDGYEILDRLRSTESLTQKQIRRAEIRDRIAARTLLASTLATIIGATSFLSFVVFGDSKADIMGDAPRSRPQSETEEVLARKIRDEFVDAETMQGRFRLQFVEPKRVRAVAYDHGNGLLAVLNQQQERSMFEPHKYADTGSSCLNDTPYEVSSVGADIVNHGEVFEVVPKNPNIPHLYLSQEYFAGPYKPLEGTSVDILTSHNCPVS